MGAYPTFYLLNPDRLLFNRSEVNESCPPNVREELASCTRRLKFCSNAEALTQLSETFNKISSHLALETEILPGEAESNEHNTQEKYIVLVDNYMGVERISGDPLSVLIQCIFQSYGKLLEEAEMAGTSLEAKEWTHLRNGFESILGYIAQEPVTESVEEKLYLPTTYSESKNDYDPLRRWVFGHHVFYVLIQSLIVAFSCFKRAIESEKIEEANTALGLATALMWSSESALHFAADFSTSGYKEVVRPSMMPPNSPPGLSGQFSGDHVYLVKLLATLKPLFANLNPSLRPQHEQFVEAFKAAYSSHKFVCGRFGGGEEVSLRMNAKTQKTAVDVLEDLKNARLKSVNPLSKS